MIIETDRLVLRSWLERDRDPFAALNADPEVMRYFPDIQRRDVSDASVDKRMAHDKEHGFCFWAADLKEANEFIGFIGMEIAHQGIPGAGLPEIGWRLRKDIWGKGLAPEGARACLAYAFSALKASEVISITSENNVPSMRVMEKIGMHRDHDNDFDHPDVPDESPIKPHVLYRISADTFGR
ncbi:GNAT family N-acetyltransferase [Kordiimonas sp. SCSIO 12610]|uniref:GNAT family N-acetyltransferase n=1 Tax=Kordiimonas sp. SCSIO 12610 TaxID=2829597 RepID=UPI00210D73E9|nr:GNAT family N-acetyltransferase [Kordiimonas sp. SCSIO 12610]UTW54271.1 GNAT family N-acetyltransferase [Kordiimonas sp. SCSIO 12610]